MLRMPSLSATSSARTLKAPSASACRPSSATPPPPTAITPSPISSSAESANFTTSSPPSTPPRLPKTSPSKPSSPKPDYYSSADGWHGQLYSDARAGCLDQLIQPRKPQHFITEERLRKRSPNPPPKISIQRLHHPRHIPRRIRLKLRLITRNRLHLLLQLR